MIKRISLVLAIGLTSLLSGCASQSGCQATGTDTCTTMTQANNAASANTTKDSHNIISSQVVTQSIPVSGEKDITLTNTGCKVGKDSVAFRTKETVLKVWIAPFVDKQGYLHEPSNIAFVLNDPQWGIDNLGGCQ